MADGCTIDGCTRPAARAGLCWGHLKRRQRGSTVGVELRPAAGGQAPVSLETSRSLFLDAAVEYAHVEPDDDEAYHRALERLEKAAVAFARRKVTAKARAALAARKAAGLAVGRPPIVTLPALRRALRLGGGVRAAARMLRVRRTTIQRAMRRWGVAVSGEDLGAKSPAERLTVKV